MTAAFGTTTPECPSCSTSLKAFPKRKTKCPACSKPIYVRTRPSDRAKILVSEDQLPVVEIEWQRIAERERLLRMYRQGLDAERDALTKKFGGRPRDEDVLWSLLNKERTRSAQTSKWGLYRNATLGMGDILKVERRYEEALRYYLEVAYLDLNGPNNISSLDYPFLRQRFPPFSPNPNEIAPGVLRYVCELAHLLELSDQDILDRYVKAAESLRLRVDLPCSMPAAIEQFNEARRNGA